MIRFGLLTFMVFLGALPLQAADAPKEITKEVAKKKTTKKPKVLFLDLHSTVVGPEAVETISNLQSNAFCDAE